MRATKISGELQYAVQTSQKERVRKELFLNTVEIDAGFLSWDRSNVLDKYSLQAEII